MKFGDKEHAKYLHDFTPTDTKHFHDVGDNGAAVEIIVEIVNNASRYSWQMTIIDNEDRSYATLPTTRYHGVLVLETPIGTWGYATDYWAGTLPVETPFKIEAAEKA